MKDLVSYSLEVNILMQSNISKKKLFDLVILAIDYYWPIQPSIPTKSIFFWLDRLNLFVGLPTNLNRIKSESHNNNCDMGREDNKMFWTKEMPPTNPNCTESKSHGNICSKNHHNISNKVGI